MGKNRQPENFWKALESNRRRDLHQSNFWAISPISWVLLWPQNHQHTNFVTHCSDPLISESGEEAKHHRRTLPVGLPVWFLPYFISFMGASNQKRREASVSIEEKSRTSMPKHSSIPQRCFTIERFESIWCIHQQQATVIFLVVIKNIRERMNCTLNASFQPTS